MYRNCPEEYGIARCLRTGYPNPFGWYDDFEDDFEDEDEEDDEEEEDEE